MRVEQRAELVVYPTEETDDFDPDALTALLGITPTKLYRKDEVLKTGRVRPFSAWMWETAERLEHDSERLVQEVLDTFEAVAVQLASARSGWGLDLQAGLERLSQLQPYICLPKRFVGSPSSAAPWTSART